MPTTAESASTKTAPAEVPDFCSTWGAGTTRGAEVDRARGTEDDAAKVLEVSAFGREIDGAETPGTTDSGAEGSGAFGSAGACGSAEASLTEKSGLMASKFCVVPASGAGVLFSLLSSIVIIANRRGRRHKFKRVPRPLFQSEMLQ